MKKQKQQARTNTFRDQSKRIHNKSNIQNPSRANSKVKVKPKGLSSTSKSITKNLKPDKPMLQPPIELKEAIRDIEMRSRDLLLREKQFQQTQLQYNQRLDSIQKQNSMLNASNQEINKARIMLHNQLQNQKMELIRLKDQFEAKQNEMSLMRKTLNTQTSDLTRLASQLQAKKKEVVKMKSSSDQQNRVKELSQRLLKLSAQLQDKSKTIKKVTADKVLAEERCDRLLKDSRDKETQFKSDFARNRDQLQQARHQIKTLKNSLEKATLQAYQANDNSKIVQELTEELTKRKEMTRVLQQKNKQLRGQNDKLSKNSLLLDKLRCQAQKSNQTIEQLKSQKQSLQEKIRRNVQISEMVQFKVKQDKETILKKSKECQELQNQLALLNKQFKAQIQLLTIQKAKSKQEIQELQASVLHFQTLSQNSQRQLEQLQQSLNQTQRTHNQRLQTIQMQLEAALSSQQTLLQTNRKQNLQIHQNQNLINSITQKLEEAIRNKHNLLKEKQELEHKLYLQIKKNQNVQHSLLIMTQALKRKQAQKNIINQTQQPATTFSWSNDSQDFKNMAEKIESLVRQNEQLRLHLQRAKTSKIQKQEDLDQPSLPYPYVCQLSTCQFKPLDPFLPLKNSLIFFQDLQQIESVKNANLIFICVNDKYELFDLLEIKSKTILIKKKIAFQPSFNNQFIKDIVSQRLEIVAWQAQRLDSSKAKSHRQYRKGHIPSSQSISDQEEVIYEMIGQEESSPLLNPYNTNKFYKSNQRVIEMKVPSQSLLNANQQEGVSQSLLKEYCQQQNTNRPTQITDRDQPAIVETQQSRVKQVEPEYNIINQGQTTQRQRLLEQTTQRQRLPEQTPQRQRLLDQTPQRLCEQKSQNQRLPEQRDQELRRESNLQQSQLLGERLSAKQLQQLMNRENCPVQEQQISSSILIRNRELICEGQVSPANRNLEQDIDFDQIFPSKHKHAIKPLQSQNDNCNRPQDHKQDGFWNSYQSQAVQDQPPYKQAAGSKSKQDKDQFWSDYRPLDPPSANYQNQIFQSYKQQQSIEYEFKQEESPEKDTEYKRLKNQIKHIINEHSLVPEINTSGYTEALTYSESNGSQMLNSFGFSLLQNNSQLQSENKKYHAPLDQVAQQDSAQCSPQKSEQEPPSSISASNSKVTNSMEIQRRLELEQSGNQFKFLAQKIDWGDESLHQSDKQRLIEYLINQKDDLQYLVVKVDGHSDINYYLTIIELFTCNPSLSLSSEAIQKICEQASVVEAITNQHTQIYFRKALNKCRQLQNGEQLQERLDQISQSSQLNQQGEGLLIKLKVEGLTFIISWLQDELYGMRQE